MAEQVWERTHDPTASVASEQSTIGHCNDGDQTQPRGHHQEPKIKIKNLQNMHEKLHPPTGARRRMELAYQDWARLQGRDHAGFYGEWSDTLTKLPEKLADAQVVRWQSKYGREPTIQQRAWLVSKVRSDIAMMATKLNAQVIIKNLQNMHEKSLPPTGRGEGWNWSIRTGPVCKARDHARADLSTAP